MYHHHTLDNVQITISVLLCLAALICIATCMFSNRKTIKEELNPKRLITLAALFIVFTAHAQTKAVKDANGNYVASHKTDTTGNKATGKTFTDSKGKSYPVYESVNGKLFYYRTSKAGNVYKAYIKVDLN